MRPIETDGSQIFNVPNNAEGQEFVRLMRKFINRPQYKYRMQGRGPRPRPVGYRRSPWHQSIPQHMSQWLAVYIRYSSRRNNNVGR